jgi:hypothetical protein
VPSPLFAGCFHEGFCRKGLIGKPGLYTTSPSRRVSFSAEGPPVCDLETSRLVERTIHPQISRTAGCEDPGGRSSRSVAATTVAWSGIFSGQADRFLQPTSQRVSWYEIVVESGLSTVDTTRIRRPSQLALHRVGMAHEALRFGNVTAGRHLGLSRLRHFAFPSAGRCSSGVEPPRDTTHSVMLAHVGTYDARS